MTPDAATLARRRHTATIIVRSLIAMFAAWMLWGAVVGLGTILQPMLEGGVAYLFQGLWNFLTLHVPVLILVAAMVLLEQRLVRWIVPVPGPDHLCPTCGYSLRDLESPICPECGTSLRSPISPPPPSPPRAGPPPPPPTRRG